MGHPEHSNGVVRFRPPGACTGAELGEFERLVREGFRGSDEALPGRIRDARWLAFHHAEDGSLAAIAALKQPAAAGRDDVFRLAAAPGDPAGYRIELGWVFVVFPLRGKGIAGRLCAGLMERAAGSCVYATTRTDNGIMARILSRLGFAPEGSPFLRRDQELALFLRPRPRHGDPGFQA